MKYMNLERTIFRDGSTTYYWSSKFFPRDVRSDVFKLYSFVRTVDDYVDSTPPKRAAFKALRRNWRAAIADPHFDPEPLPEDTLDERVIKNMVAVHRKYAFDPAWVAAFFDSMQADLDGREYQTIDDTLWYMYGSAEVIGLMMAKIMNLSPEAYGAAKVQGRAMQFINFLRDVAEDYDLGRQYIPQEDLDRFELPNLARETAREFPAAFKKLMQYELARYDRWQTEANAGLQHVPSRLRIPLKTAIDMYNWTGKQIARSPLLIYDRKVKPQKTRVLRSGIKNALRP